jgi:LPXTG-site transpeptidase (sortase) family protein
MFRNSLSLYRTVISFTFLVFGLIFYPRPALANEPLFEPTRLVVPIIALDNVIVPVGLKTVEANGQSHLQWMTDDNRVGWHNLTVPLGQVGNTVLNGHSDIHTKVFKNLEQVEIGSEIIVYSGAQAYHYIVAEKFLVQEKGASVEQRLEHAKLILPTQDERLTLITCSQTGATHRLIVIAHRLAAN